MTHITVEGTTMHLRGADLLLSDYLTAWTKEMYDQVLLGFVTGHLAEGVHPMIASAERSFGQGECVINGQELEYARIDAEFGVRIIRPAVVSHYEVSTRGRVIRLAQVVIDNIAFDTAFVTALSD